MFFKDYEIKFYEVDYKNQLKESVLLNFLQDIAATHAEELGFGYSYIKDKNLGWFLLKYHLKVYEYPKNLNKVTIRTWPKAINKLSCLRDFEIYTSEGEKIASVCSSWVLIDTTTKKIMQPMQVLQKFPTKNADAFETNFPKLQEFQNPDCKKIFEVRYDDIDINRHVNNANYLIWALETLDFDFRSQNVIKELEIQYKKEMKHGDDVTSIAEINKDTLITNHILKNSSTDEILCSIRSTWQKSC